MGWSFPQSPCRGQSIPPVALRELLQAEKAFYPPAAPPRDSPRLLPLGVTMPQHPPTRWDAAACILPACQGRGVAWGEAAWSSAASSQHKISPSPPRWCCSGTEKPLNKAAPNPSEVPLPAGARQELCLSTKSLKPSPNLLISVSTTSLFSVTFPLTHRGCRLPDNSLASLSAGAF